MGSHEINQLLTERIQAHH